MRAVLAVMALGAVGTTSVALSVLTHEERSVELRPGGIQVETPVVDDEARPLDAPLQDAGEPAPSDGSPVTSPGQGPSVAPAAGPAGPTTAPGPSSDPDPAPEPDPVEVVVPAPANPVPPIAPGKPANPGDNGQGGDGGQSPDGNNGSSGNTRNGTANP